MHGLLAFAGMTLALPLALIGGMALVGSVSEPLWVRVAVPSAVLLVGPLLLADRLLPSDPNQRRPGLVRDVLAASWMVAALAVLGWTSSFSSAPLRAEAERHDARGWARAAWLSRWLAGPEPSAAEVEVAQLEVARVEATPEPARAEAMPKGEAAPKVEAPPAEAAVVASESASPAATEPASASAPVSDDDAEAREYTPSELFARFAPAVVSIKVDHGGFHSGGTGFFIASDGTIATNHHVIRNASEVQVELFDGTEHARVELLTSDAEADLALLRIEVTPPVFVELGNSDAVEVGEPVSVIGNPLGLDHTLTNGIVSARRIYEGERFIQMSAPISPGNSGGPVFDAHGRVIGVSVAQMIGGQNLNLAVPINQLRSLVSEEYPNRRSFGASSW